MRFVHVFFFFGFFLLLLFFFLDRARDNPPTIAPPRANAPPLIAILRLCLCKNLTSRLPMGRCRRAIPRASSIILALSSTLLYLTFGSGFLRNLLKKATRRGVLFGMAADSKFNL